MTDRKAIVESGAWALLGECNRESPHNQALMTSRKGQANAALTAMLPLLREAFAEAVEDYQRHERGPGRDIFGQGIARLVREVSL